MRKSRLILIILLFLMLSEINQVFAQNNDLSIKIKSESSCIAGFQCYLNVTIKNLDGSILINYIKFVTPWGVFIRNLGFRKLDANSTMRISIPVNVSRNSLEGPNFIVPFVEYFKKGEIGLKTIRGNRTSLLVVRPKANATMYVTLSKEELYIGDILRINGSYVIRGIPENFKPSLSIYLDSQLQLRKELNGTSGDFRAFISPKNEGNFTLKVSLCYGVGCINKEFNLTVRKMVKIITGFNKSILTDSLKNVNKMKADLDELYKEAISDSIPLPEDILVNMSIISSKIKEVESILKRNITYSDILKVQKLLNQSKGMILEVSNEIIGSYKEAIREKISKLRDELNGITNINKTEYRIIEEKLDNMSIIVSKANSTNISFIYSNVTKELNSLNDEVMKLREKALQEAKLLSAIILSLIFVAMISGAIIILREWKSRLNRE